MTVAVGQETPLEKGLKRPPRLLIVEDDESLGLRLSRAMQNRGYDTVTAPTAKDAEQLIDVTKPDFAVIDMRLEDGNGLELVPRIHASNPEARIVVLTGYGNIATAVLAIKSGAVDYLAKPASIDDIVAAFQSEPETLPPPPDFPMSADRARWEHIQRVYEQCGRNMSEAARRLRMHRRTLQRILTKHAPRR